MGGMGESDAVCPRSRMLLVLVQSAGSVGRDHSPVDLSSVIAAWQISSLVELKLNIET